MTHLEPGTLEREPMRGTGGAPAGLRDVSWRYIGDRAAADSAYCARFGVTQAPEPWVALGGAWAYVLPAAAPPE